jgi:copper homeostasis protein
MNASRESRDPLIEVCVGSLSDAIVAASAGADRLELCSATELGGLTPSVGLLEQVIGTIALPVVVMIRPRAGGFCYSHEDFRTAVRDAELAIQRGAHGIAFGFLSPNGQIDAARCRELVRIAEQRQTVFHRAFDFVPDPLRAADQLAELGVTRVLTSGQQPTAIAGAALIRTIRERMNGLLEVMPGGGICAEHVCDLLRRTRCSQIHIGAARSVIDSSTNRSKSMNLGASSFVMDGRYRAVQESLVAGIAHSIETGDVSRQLQT